MKDINKSYGIPNYIRFSKKYFEILGISDSMNEAKIKVNLYAVWWAIDRIKNLQDVNLKNKFSEKLKVLLQEIKNEQEQ